MKTLKEKQLYLHFQSYFSDLNNLFRNKSGLKMSQIMLIILQTRGENCATPYSIDLQWL